MNCFNNNNFNNNNCNTNNKIIKIKNNNITKTINKQKFMQLSVLTIRINFLDYKFIKIDF